MDSKIITYAAVGVGIYLLYETLIAPSIGNAVVATTPPTGGTGVSPVVQPANTAPSQTLAKVIAKATALNLPTQMNADQWNWVAHQIGIEPPDPMTAFPQFKTGQLDRVKYTMGASEWYTAMSQHGLQGIAGLGGWGRFF